MPGGLSAMLKKINFGLLSLALVFCMVRPIPAHQQTLTIAVLWGGKELNAFKTMVAPFEKKSGIEILIEPVGRDLPTVLMTRFFAGNPPDLAAMPNPGQMKEFILNKGLVPLDKRTIENHEEAIAELGLYKGKLYGVFISVDIKSLIWYSPKQFEAESYKVPDTWDELIALSEKIAADGRKPWCIGLESGAASGWPGTDWIEDILLRTAGPKFYDRWVNHEIKWTHPKIFKAWDYFGQIARNSKYLFGGTTAVLTTNFSDSPLSLFSDPPGSYLHRQATFIQQFIKKNNPELVPMKDYNIFVFPSINNKFRKPLLGSGDLISVFKDSVEARRFIRYLASSEAQRIWIKETGKLGVSKQIDISLYEDPIAIQAAKILHRAPAFRFDGSDLMPAAVGSGAFWKGVLDYVSGENLDKVLRNIEESAEYAYDH
jgi:alpha-glucoside transport system substrate-binding protein